MRTTHQLHRLCVVFGFVMCFGACDRDDGIRVYRSPKDQMTSVSDTPSSPHTTMTSTTRSNEQPGKLQWAVPTGWTEQPGDSPMRYATLTDQRTTPPTEITVTRLGTKSGSLLANVNRWRGQLGLPPTDETGLAHMTHSLERSAMPATIVNIAAPASDTDSPQRMLAAVFAQPDATWFFKLSNTSAIVEAAEPDFLALCRSIHLEPAASAPPSSPSSAIPNMMPGMGDGPPELTQPQNAGPLTFVVPEGWKQDPSPRMARIATLLIDDAPSTELAISRFPGDVGGELANVNRWRNQLGLPPIATLGAQEATTVTIGNHPARVYRFAALTGNENASAMFVALLPMHDETWFFKLTGPVSSVDAQRTRFEAFINSVSFTR